MRNPGEAKWPVILGIAICGGSFVGVGLCVCCRYWRVVGCVFQCRKLACSRRVLMVSVGVGRLSNLVCMDVLGAIFWQHRVVL
jgi:hypothetical protein